MKAEFGKSEKIPLNFMILILDYPRLREKLRRGLQQLLPESVAIQFLPKCKDPVIPEQVVTEHISNNVNVERFETVERVSVCTMKEYAENFKCQNNININGHISEETRQSFIKINLLLLIRISVISFAAKRCIKVAVSSGMTSDQDV